jgi:hypothetical protein
MPSTSSGAGAGRRTSALVLIAFGATLVQLPAAVTAPWLKWRIGLPDINDNYVAQFHVATLAANAGRLRIILECLVATMSRTDLFGFLWYVAVAALAIGVRGPNRVLAASTAMPAGRCMANVLACLVASWPIEDLLSASVHRVALHMMPGAVPILPFGWPRAAAAGDA